MKIPLINLRRYNATISILAYTMGMTCTEVMEWLEAHGTAQTTKIYLRHGASEPLFGVKIGDLKTLMPKIKNDNALAEQLWATDNYDAMYLAGHIADNSTITVVTLRRWMKGAYAQMLSEVAVAGLAAESKHGWKLGIEWIESATDFVCAGGWATLGSCISYWDNDVLPLDEISKHLRIIQTTIHSMPNRVRYCMNNYIICVGSYIPSLLDASVEAAQAIGVVSVDVGQTSCKVPNAEQYIQKIADMGRIGKKRKYVRC